MALVLVLYGQSTVSGPKRTKWSLISSWAISGGKPPTNTLREYVSRAEQEELEEEGDCEKELEALQASPNGLRVHDPVERLRLSSGDICESNSSVQL